MAASGSSSMALEFHLAVLDNPASEQLPRVGTGLQMILSEFQNFSS
jgi:hypothetical protein